MKKLVLILFIFSLIFNISAQQLAFPGAEGFGRFATGGRGGEVVHVTNLNDDGAGSFRDAVSKPNRIVVFDVGGIINITSRIVIQRNIYVAGQTAPGDGIMLYGNGVALNSSSGNSIIRYIRIRMGENGDYRKDALGISDGQDYMFDHVSISWGWDGTVDVNGSNIDNITFQDCIIGQGIDIVGHSTGGLMQSGKWSVIRSIYVDNETRNPKGKGTHEVMNCVMYNWGSNGYIMGSSDGLSEVNAVGNHFIYGPSSSSNSHITGTTPSFHVYGADNWVDSDKDGVFDPYAMTDYKTATLINTPFPYNGMDNVMPANEAFEYVLTHAGSSMPHDAVDQFLINEIRSFGTEGKIIDRESDNGIPGNVGTLAGGTTPTDTDRDGMPDSWELERGLDPNVADDKGDDDGDGYTNIEEYLSCLVGEGDACVYNPRIDCNGVTNGTAYLDQCSVCVGGNTGLQACYVDCNGDKDGTAVIDDCGVCSGGNTGVTACAGAIQGEDFCEATGVQEASNLNFVGTGYANLDNALGSSASYYLHSESIKSVHLNVRVANGSSDARGMNVLINDFTQATIPGAQTGDWDVWVDEGITVDLVAGVNKITLEANTGDGGPNIDLISFEDESLNTTGCNLDCNGELGGVAFLDDCNQCVGGSTGQQACSKDCNGDINGSAYLDDCGVCVGGHSPFIACQQTIEAEYPCLIDGLELESKNEGYSGEGYANTDNALGAKITWQVNSTIAQNATLSFRYANGGTTPRDGNLFINETSIGIINLEATGAWDSWSTTAVNISLSAGVNELTIEAITADGLANIDLLGVSQGIEKEACLITNTMVSLIKNSLNIYPNPCGDELFLDQRVEWTLYNSLGQFVAKGQSDRLDLSTYASGLYTLNIDGVVYQVLKK